MNQPHPHGLEYIGGLMQGRRNSIANAQGLRLLH